MPLRLMPLRLLPYSSRKDHGIHIGATLLTCLNILAPERCNADTFDAHQVRGEAAIIFDHLAVQNVEGASVFWIRRLAAMGGEHEALARWQTKRDHTRRGIVEVISDDSERSGT